MAHHGWVQVLAEDSITPEGLKSPFGRLFGPTDSQYQSYAISLLSGALGPIQRLNPALKDANPAGFTFLGQFIDHDLTEFRVVGEQYSLIPQNPVIGQRQRVLEDGDPVSTTNGRSGRLDLDSVYGLLGSTQLSLFDDDGLFRLDGDTDILRGSAFRNGRLIGDPRNDENKIIVQLHLLFERLHNRLNAAAGGSAAQRGPGGASFLATRTEVQNAYRRIVLHDYLPRIVQWPQMRQVLDALQTGRSHYQAMNGRCRAQLRARGLPEAAVADAVAMPVEFAHAVFRLGHTQLRNGYALNNNLSLPLFATGAGGVGDLRGNEPIVGNLVIDWAHFFDLGGGVIPQSGQPIDGVLPDSVFRLPPPAIGEPPISLAERNIRRGVDFGLPSGQEVASRLSDRYGFIPQTTFDDLFPPELQQSYKEILAVDPTLAWNTPLWYFVIREATKVPTSHLGPVGGLVVAETILGSLFATDGFDLDAEVSRIQFESDGVTVRFPSGTVTTAGEIRSMAQLINFL